MTIGQRIKDLRLKNNLTQENVAKYVGVAIQTIYKYENGIVTNIPPDKIELIAKILDTTPAYIMGWKISAKNDIASLEKYGIRPIKTKKFPMLKEIVCGKPVYCSESRIVSDNIDADFCLIAKGDSMINARIFDGDIVFVHEQQVVNNGEIAAVIIGNSAMLKRVYFKPDKIILRPENPTYDDLIFENETMNMVGILGKAVAFQSLVR